MCPPGLVEVPLDLSRQALLFNFHNNPAFSDLVQHATAMRYAGNTDTAGAYKRQDALPLDRKIRLMMPSASIRGHVGMELNQVDEYGLPRADL